MGNQPFSRSSFGRRQSLWTMVIAIALASLSCGKKVTDERVANKTVPASDNAARIQLVDDPGLPAFCKEVPVNSIDSLNARGVGVPGLLPPRSAPTGFRQLCLQCQPRELVRHKCLIVKDGPLESVCRNNVRTAGESGKDPVLSCDGQVVGGKVIDGEFALKPNRVEQVITAMPFVAVVLRSRVIPSLQAGSKARLLAERAFEFATTHAKPVMLGQGFDGAGDFILATVDSHRALDSKPALTAEKKTELRELASNTFMDISFLVSRVDSMDKDRFTALTSTIATRFPDVAPWQFVLPALFAEGGESLLMPGIGDALPPELIAIIVNALGQATASRPSPAP